MNPREKGFLLLTSHLGNPDRKVLSTAQLRILADRVQHMPRPREDRNLTASDLMALGYGRDMALRILALLDEEELLEHYVNKGVRLGCVPIGEFILKIIYNVIENFAYIFACFPCIKI